MTDARPVLDDERLAEINAHLARVKEHLADSSSRRATTEEKLSEVKQGVRRLRSIELAYGDPDDRLKPDDLPFIWMG